MIRNERGIAMAICLFVLAALSGITVAALSMSHSDIVTSRNYRSASQSLAAAEAGIGAGTRVMLYLPVAPLRAAGVTANAAAPAARPGGSAKDHTPRPSASAVPVPITVPRASFTVTVTVEFAFVVPSK